MVRSPLLVIASVASVLTVGLLISAAGTAEPAKPSESKAKPDANRVRANQASDFMALKLNHVQKTLEGIAIEDYDLIAKNAERLGLLSQDENWMVFQTPEYRRHSGEFQQAAADLAKAAKQKNIDSATLAYLQLTMTCVNCHKHTRSLQKEVTP